MRKDEDRISTTNLIIMTLVSSLINTYIAAMQYFFDYYETRVLDLPIEFISYKYSSELLLAVILLLFCNLYRYLVKQGIKNKKQESIIIKSEQEKIHYKEVQMLYHETDTWRKGYKKQIKTISYLLKNDRKDDIIKYIDNIEKSTHKMEFRVNTGNELMDAIINSKITKAESQGIEFMANIQTSISEEMAQVDMTTLIGNLLDNAIEGCERVGDDTIKKEILLQVYNIKGQIGIYVKNTAANIKQDESGRYITSKSSENHGIGLTQIDAIVEKYNGYISRNAKGKNFETLIRLPSV
ncbi:MAG: sensor histidine kinase [Suipraeoptans sp.]